MEKKKKEVVKGRARLDLSRFEEFERRLGVSPQRFSRVLPYWKAYRDVEVEVI